MKINRTWLILVPFMLISSRAAAQDGIFSDAQTLRLNQLAIAIQPIVYTESEELMLNFRGAYGLQSGLTIHGKVGILRDETYVGGHLEYRLAGEPRSPLSFALLAGVYSFGELGLKLSGVISKKLDPFSIYTGLSYEPLFAASTRNPFLLPAGLDIPLFGRNANVILEGDIGLNGDGEGYQAVHFGVNFYL